MNAVGASTSMMSDKHGRQAGRWDLPPCLTVCTFKFIMLFIDSSKYISFLRYAEM